jgi:hypothetical protein
MQQQSQSVKRKGMYKRDRGYESWFIREVHTESLRLPLSEYLKAPRAHGV